jgi:hypothetical protein
MDRRLLYLAALVLAPWLAIVGGAVMAWGALVSREPWHIAAGGTVIGLAVGGGVVAYGTLKRYRA